MSRPTTDLQTENPAATSAACERLRAYAREVLARSPEMLTDKQAARVHASVRAMRDMTVEEARAGAPEHDVLVDDMLRIDAALEELGQHDPRAAAVMEMRMFGGFRMADIARTEGLSLYATECAWRHAREWMRSRLAS